MSVAETIFLCPDAQDLCILGIQGKLLVEGWMSIARRSAQAYYFVSRPSRMTSTPPASERDGTH
jgi:hypothetical protein